MKVYIWQKGSLRLGNEECQEVLAALLIACYCAPARAQIDETRVFSTFLHLPNIWPDGWDSWFSSNIWADGCEFWFSINIWSIFDYTNAALGFQSIFGQYLSRLVRPSHFWQILAFRVLVTARQGGIVGLSMNLGNPQKLSMSDKNVVIAHFRNKNGLITF